MSHKMCLHKVEKWTSASPCAAAMIAGPAAAAASVALAAMICGTAAPWASNIYILFALGLVPALAASLGVFALTHAALKLLKGPTAERPTEKAPELPDEKPPATPGKSSTTPNKKKDKPAAKKVEEEEPLEPEPEDRTAAAYVTPDEAGLSEFVCDSIQRVLSTRSVCNVSSFDDYVASCLRSFLGMSSATPYTTL